ncbi:MAG: hypothetical protein PHQ04_08220 [Opitutaceae bacterium]|nr:hypothetical protein [Opitutaceae bacterium]
MKRSPLIPSLVIVLFIALLESGCVSHTTESAREPLTFAIVAVDDTGVLSQAQLKTVENDLIQYLIDTGLAEKDMRFIDDPTRADTVFRVRLVGTHAWGAPPAIAYVSPSYGSRYSYTPDSSTYNPIYSPYPTFPLWPYNYYYNGLGYPYYSPLPYYSSLRIHHPVTAPPAPMAQPSHSPRHRPPLPAARPPADVSQNPPRPSRPTIITPGTERPTETPARRPSRPSIGSRPYPERSSPIHSPAPAPSFSPQSPSSNPAAAPALSSPVRENDGGDTRRRNVSER